MHVKAISYKNTRILNMGLILVANALNLNGFVGVDYLRLSVEFSDFG